ncbi:MAG: hypothetical protein H6531_01545 [Actinobacteria bacterium]|nr:hypothetical protein [Actinomycetota bacterium]MCB9010495.1 hypothetical protein [Actinomycetota bacterium]
MDILVAILIVGLLGAAGTVGAIWRLGVALGRRTARVGTRGIDLDMALRQFRRPLLIWSLLLAGSGVLVTGLGWDSGAVRVGALIGAVIGIGILVVAPLVVTTLGARLLDRLRGHVMMRVSRRP